MKERSIHIKGVTGIRHIPFIDRWEGKRDAANNQLCKTEDGVSTPRIVSKCRSCDSYTNALYIEAVEKLKTLYTEIAICVSELDLLRNNTLNDELEPIKLAELKEEEIRQVARKNARRKSNDGKIKALIIRMAELRQNCHNIDEELNHRIAQAKAVLHEHVSNYWSGVLQSSAADLPINPEYTEAELSGRREYLEQYNRVLEMFSKSMEVTNELI